MENNSIYITRYLSGDMSEQERKECEEKIRQDKSLLEEWEAQQAIIQAVIRSGAREEIAHAYKRHKQYRLLSRAGGVVVFLLLLGVFFRYMYPGDGHKIDSRNDFASVIEVARKIHPAIQGVDVPFVQYEFDAEKGDTIFHPSGSILCFPAFSLLHRDGSLVKGPVTIAYREFADPVDFFISGIPMQYDSAGKPYQFESSAMCEVRAQQQGEPLQVNSKQLPTLHLSSRNNSPLHNLYFFDSTSGQWIYRGKDEVTEAAAWKKNVKRKISSPSNETGALPAQPVMPVRATGDKPSFSIEIDPGSFQELVAYDKLKFEVLDQKSYNRSDADEHWESVDLKHTDAGGVYLITFRNEKRSVTYKVRPVLEGEDYDKALKDFEIRKNNYERALKEREANMKRMADSMQNVHDQMVAREREKAEKLNELIIRRNKQLRELARSKEGELNRYEKYMAAQQIDQNFTFDESLILLNQNRQKFAEDVQLNGEIIRSFAMTQMGIWNCDRPRFSPDEIPIQPRFAEQSGQEIQFYQLAVVYKQFNGLQQYTMNQPLRLVPGSQSMIWAVKDRYLYYYNYADFATSGINRSTRSFTFSMRKWEEEIQSFWQCKSILQKL